MSDTLGSFASFRDGLSGKMTQLRRRFSQGEMQVNRLRRSSTCREGRVFFSARAHPWTNNICKRGIHRLCLHVVSSFPMNIVVWLCKNHNLIQLLYIARLLVQGDDEESDQQPGSLSNPSANPPYSALPTAAGQNQNTMYGPPSMNPSQKDRPRDMSLNLNTTSPSVSPGSASGSTSAVPAATSSSMQQQQQQPMQYQQQQRPLPKTTSAPSSPTKNYTPASKWATIQKCIKYHTCKVFPRNESHKLANPPNLAIQTVGNERTFTRNSADDFELNWLENFRTPEFVRKQQFFDWVHPLYRDKTEIWERTEDEPIVGNCQYAFYHRLCKHKKREFLRTVRCNISLSCTSNKERSMPFKYGAVTYAHFCDNQPMQVPDAQDSDFKFVIGVRITAKDLCIAVQ